MHGSLLHYYSNIIGIVGVGLVLLAYMLLHLHKMSAHSISYSATNAVGSMLILVSLYYHLNLASLVIEIAWLLISLMGVCKALYLARRKA